MPAPKKHNNSNNNNNFINFFQNFQYKQHKQNYGRWFSSTLPACVDNRRLRLTAHCTTAMWVVYILLCKSRNQGCTNIRRLVTRVTKFCSVVPNIFSIIIAASPWHTNMRISSHAPRRKRQLPLTSTGQYSIVGTQYGSSLLVHFWHTEFGGGSWIFGRFVYPWSKRTT
jgi:hypothetical protein